MGTYGHDFDRLKKSFIEFGNNLPFYGSVALCIDDPNVFEIMPLISESFNIFLEIPLKVISRNYKYKVIPIGISTTIPAIKLLRSLAKKDYLFSFVINQE